MNVSQALAEGRAALVTRLGDQQAALESDILLATTLGQCRAWAYAHPEHDVGTAVTRYRSLVSRRVSGEPLEYIRGQAEFFGLALSVSPLVLVPRPETEVLVEVALSALAGQGMPVVADVGTGSGAIALAIAANEPGAKVVATDVSWSALTVAACNVHLHALGERVSLVCCDLLSAVSARFHLIAANLPYVASEDLLGVSLEVVRFEPQLALDGGPTGLEQVERLLGIARFHLVPGGLLLAEIGAMQGGAAIAMARDVYPEGEVCLVRDLAGLDRVLQLRLPA